MELWVEQNAVGQNDILALEDGRGSLETFRKLLGVLERFPVVNAMVPAKRIIAKANLEDWQIRFEWPQPAPGGWTPSLTMPFESAICRSLSELEKLIEEKIGRPV